ncbi:hypothetical protein [Lactococcus formosensis]|uniref:Uncharacterized protein n=2 Tax=Lactococcus TaxID=1357 RepID=A0A9Q8Y342_9LACT|nr:hypothetical protein [Lactococcus formosensis]USJ21165.1 hypothetical protein LMK00_03960 [Lactococcus formosensis]
MGALFALVEAQKGHNAYRPVRSYRCSECHLYHLTSKQHFGFQKEMGTLAEGGVA